MSEIRKCCCRLCQSGEEHPDRAIHHQINLLMSRLDEQQRRWYAALEAQRYGHGGIRLASEITGLAEKTIRRGMRELARQLSECPGDRIRLKGAGRTRVEHQQPGLLQALNELIRYELAGDPIHQRCWIRRSLTELRQALLDRGFSLCRQTVRRLLGQKQIRLRSNRKCLSGEECPDRDIQFEYIQTQRHLFEAAGWPCISVDTKKKELIGPYKNAGRVWCPEPEEVAMYDFPTEAVGKAVPYGVYDVHHNQGYVAVGQSADTPEFAVDAIVRWWHSIGSRRYPNAPELLILADGGGSNGYRPRLWKQQLQEKLADAFGLAVTVCHYPLGASKWNPIEHRLFSEITKTWAGTPLASFDLMLHCIRDTHTQTGLHVEAELIPSLYQKGIKVSNDQMNQLLLEKHATCPKWNYTIRPRSHIQKTGTNS